MNKNLINEHDITKRMIDVLRNPSLIAEVDESSDAITPNTGDSNYADELKKFSDTVDPRMQVTKFKIYPNDREVQFEGRLDSGINFYMSIRAMKLSISVTDDNGDAIKVFVDSDLINTIQKLNGYYENWTREWAQKLATDYKPMR